MSFAAVYVGLPRVKNSDDIRLVEILDGSPVPRWLADLQWSTPLREWMKKTGAAAAAAPARGGVQHT